MTVELPWGDFRAGRLLRFGLPLVATALALIAIRVTTDAEPSVSRWIAVAAASGFGAIVATIIVLRATSRRFEAFKTGFRYTTAEATVLASWDQVESFYTPSVRFRRFLGRPEYRLVAGERVLSIGSQVGADVDLGRWIEARTRNSAIARAQAKVAAGIPRDFRPNPPPQRRNRDPGTPNPQHSVRQDPRSAPLRKPIQAYLDGPPPAPCHPGRQDPQRDGPLRADRAAGRTGNDPGPNQSGTHQGRPETGWPFGVADPIISGQANLIEERDQPGHDLLCAQDDHASPLLSLFGRF